MKVKNRIAIAVVAFCFAVICALPNLLLWISMVTVIFFNKLLSLIFTLVFAYNIAKLVELGYRNHIDKQEEVITEKKKYDYSINGDEIDFTFYGVKDHDGRQLDKLKFIRKQFFKGK